MISLAVCLLAALQATPPAIPQDSQPTLAIGIPLEAEISEQDLIVETPTLLRDFDDAPVRGRAYLLEAADAQPVTIEVRSYFFDAYVVVRDEGGRVLAENDDGSIATHSRLVLEPSGRPARLRIEVCALHGGVGAFRVEARPGRPAAPSPAELRALELEDAREGLRVVEGIRGPDHADTLARLCGLGLLLWRRGQYGEALPIYERAVSICEKRYGPDDPRTITSVGNVAVQLKELGEYRRAQPLLERQLKNLEATLGPDDQNTLWVLRNLAFVLAEQGEYEKATALHERALESSERVSGHDSLDSAQSVNNLANLSLKQGDSVAARAGYEHALRILESTIGPEHPIATAIMNNLANVLDQLGEYREARRVCERALAIRERTLGADHVDTAASLMTLGTLLSNGGNDEEARPVLERALATFERALGPGHPNTGRCAQSLASVLGAQREWDAAIAMSRRSLEIFERTLGPNHGDTARALGSTAWLLVNAGRHSEAAPLFEREIGIWERLVGPDHPYVAGALNCCALSRMEVGEYDEAKSLFERAIRIDRGAPTDERSNLRRHLSNLALDMGNLQRMQDAEPLIVEAWATFRGEAKGRLLVAADWERFAWINDNKWPLEVLISVLGAQKRDESSTSVYDAVRFWKGIGSRATIETRERLVSTMTPETRKTIDELRNVQSALSQEARQYDTKTREARDVRLAALRKREGELQRELADVEGDAGSHSPVPFETLARSLPDGAALVDFYVHRTYDFARRASGSRPSVGKWGERRLSAWIVRRGCDRPEWIDLGVAVDVERATRAFLAALTRDRGAGALASAEGKASAFDVANDRLRELLWRPLAAHLAGVTQLFISPDRFLGMLPFGILNMEDGRFLLERLAISYLSEADTLARCTAEPPLAKATGGDLLVFGDVAFDRHDSASLVAPKPELAAPNAASGEVARASRGRWDALPATKREIAAVLETRAAAAAGWTGTVESLEGAAATEPALKAALAGKRFVHLATHGYFEPKGLPSWWEELQRSDRVEMRMPEELRRVTGLMPGLLSGLVCAGANLPSDENRDDAYLTAEEVTWLDLSNCALVVLSACDTGVGTERGGEGMASVQRAFELAGARAAVASLWTVNDESTADLMKVFYGNLWLEKQPVGEALRNAQLELLRRERIEHDGDGQPYMWGAFVLSGDWR